MVYEKSELGLSEFNSSKRSLGVRERQVLVLVNGARNLDDLEKFFKREQLEETIQKLKVEGFIYEVSGSGTAKTSNISLTTLSFFNPETAANPINPAKIAAVKQILIDAADDYLGLMGRPLKDKIGKCVNEADLRASVSSWHMAMRESKIGRESTDFLMEQIHQTLENNLLDDNSAAHKTH